MGSLFAILRWQAAFKIHTCIHCHLCNFTNAYAWLCEVCVCVWVLDEQRCHIKLCCFPIYLGTCCSSFKSFVCTFVARILKYFHAKRLAWLLLFTPFLPLYACECVKLTVAVVLPKHLHRQCGSTIYAKTALCLLFQFVSKHFIRSIYILAKANKKLILHSNWIYVENV